MPQTSPSNGRAHLEDVEIDRAGRDRLLQARVVVGLRKVDPGDLGAGIGLPRLQEAAEQQVVQVLVVEAHEGELDALELAFLDVGLGRRRGKARRPSANRRRSASPCRRRGSAGSACAGPPVPSPVGRRDPVRWLQRRGRRHCPHPRESDAGSPAARAARSCDSMPLEPLPFQRRFLRIVFASCSFGSCSATESATRNQERQRRCFEYEASHPRGCQPIASRQANGSHAMTMRHFRHPPIGVSAATCPA